jgi:hypothetical protein
MTYKRLFCNFIPARGAQEDGASPPGAAPAFPPQGLKPHGYHAGSDGVGARVHPRSLFERQGLLVSRWGRDGRGGHMLLLQVAGIGQACHGEQCPRDEQRPVRVAAQQIGCQ